MAVLIPFPRRTDWEPWPSKKQLAAVLGSATRWIENRERRNALLQDRRSLYVPLLRSRGLAEGQGGTVISKRGGSYAVRIFVGGRQNGVGAFKSRREARQAEFDALRARARHARRRAIRSRSAGPSIFCGLRLQRDAHIDTPGQA